MVQEMPFSRSAIAALITFGVMCFAGASYFAIVEEEPYRTGSNVFSTSAVGHRAMLELLQRQGVPVVVSQHNSAMKAGDDSLLVMAEPRDFKAPELARNTLVILPKRTSVADPDHRGWVRRADLADRDVVEHIARQFVPGAEVVRAANGRNWHQPSPEMIQRWNSGALTDQTLTDRLRSRAVPQVNDIQLIWSPRLDPILSARDGILVGAATIGGKTLFVVSDPDLLANAGIGRADHAALVLDLIDMMRPADGSVVIDEVIHGYRRTPNLWRTMFERPFIAVTALAFVALGILIWAASGRFGAAIATPSARSATESDLIENTVGLLHRSGHEREIAGAYPDIVLRQLSRQLHAPRNMNEQDRAAWIDRVGAARQTGASYRALAGDIRTILAVSTGGDTQLLRSAQRLFDWQREMIDGPQRD
jgi:hypothetical protein